MDAPSDLSLRTLRRLTLGFVVAALVAVVPYLFSAQLQPRPGWNLLLLAALALLAELWPVNIFHRGIRVTFTLPYLVGIAALCSPLHALAVDVGVTLLAAVSIRVVHRQRIAMPWVLLNMANAAISAAAAGGAWLLAAKLGPPMTAGALGAAAAFVCTYSVVNFLGVTTVDHALRPNGRHENILLSFKPGVQALGLYALVAMLVALLVRMQYTPFVALTIIPIATLRYALMQKAKLYDHYYDTVTALSLMVQRVHPYTLGHLRRVSEIAEQVALELGLSAKRARLVREAAVLHDIGKIAIDENVLDKPGKLTLDEYEHVKRHAEFGAQILAQVEMFQPMVRWVRHHHERPDGSGYPDQLSDIEIPIESKIIAVVDAFDAMTGGGEGEKRSYREPLTKAEAVKELERCAGKQFDARVVATFRNVILGGSA